MIDRLEDHEAFLRAIFDAPEDDTPRLVYADFLDETGDPDWAEFIRMECEHRRLLAHDPGDPGLSRLGEVLRRQVSAHQRVSAARPGLMSRYAVYERGFDRPPGKLVVPTAELAFPPGLRARVVAERPHWFGATTVGGDPSRPLGSDEVAALLDLPFTQQVTNWDLGGIVEEDEAGPETEEGGTYALIDMTVRPVISLRGVEALAVHRGARRIRSLTLTHNGLGNDAVRALARSPHLIRLDRLDFRDGNSPKGRVWQELVARFGEQVVG